MANANAEANFRAKAPGIMAKLLDDFPIEIQAAAAIVGNAGHESLGFTALQEIKPTVVGSRGGWGWMQWTGPRRRAFEAYCMRTGKDPASDEANYAWLYLELKGIEGTEGAAIGKTQAAIGLEAKVKAFEQAFLRAGVKHYDSRIRWAKIALAAWEADRTAPADPKPAPIPVDPLPPPKTGGIKPAGVIVAIIFLALLVGAFFFVRF